MNEQGDFNTRSLIYPMRRSKQQLSKKDCIEILKSNTSGVLALIDKNSYPYAVPLSFVFSEEESSLYFHSALKGHKIEALRNANNASFCVIDADTVIQEKFTTAYRSVIVFGQAHIVRDTQTCRHGLELLVKKYSKNFMKKAQNEIENAIDHTYVIQLKIEHMSGKKGLEFRE